MTVPADPTPALQEYARPEKLVTTQWLADQLAAGRPENLVVVESDEDVLLYETGHIPGAVKIDWHLDLNDPVTRDYVDGDDVRSIDWRATARRQHAVVRTWQPERDRRVILVLDTSRTSAARVGDEPRLDAAMDAALLLTAVATRAGDRVDLVAGDRAIRARVGAGGSGTGGAGSLLHRMVTAMAPLEPVLLEADWPMLAGTVTGTTRRRALVVLLTSLEPAAVEEGLLPVLPSLTAHHRVVLASVADPGLRALREDLSGVDEVYDAAAAERTETLRRRTATGLGRLGVTVVHESPDELPEALVDHYLALKAQGLL